MKTWVLILLLFTLEQGVYGQNSTVKSMDAVSKYENVIHQLHLKKFKWLAEKQIDSLTTLLHDDVYYIHSNGWQESKKEVLENITNGKLNYSNVKVHESNTRVFDQTAIVTGKGTFYVAMDGTPYEFNLFYTEVYAFLPEGIRLLSRHACKY